MKINQNSVVPTDFDERIKILSANVDKLMEATKPAIQGIINRGDGRTKRVRKVKAILSTLS